MRLNLKATVIIDEYDRIAKINPMIYGQYLEHLEDCIYGALTLDTDDPQHVDEDGLRHDVVEKSAELQVPITRWPGGCFADIYDWKDGVGPKSKRPVRLNWFWGGLESNQFGTDEFLRWCERVGTEPYINVNMGTDTLNSAIRWLDYCNGSGPTSDVEYRIQNGRKEPYNVKYWGLGNETWGEHEPGHSDAATYGHRLREWAQFFKKVDPSVQLLGVGNLLGRDQDWNATVVRKAGHLLDFLTVHGYAHSFHLFSPEDYYPTVTSADFFEREMAETIQVITEAAEEIGLARPPLISLDEWNIRHLDLPRENEVASFRRDQYVLRRGSLRTLQDALFAAGVFHAMHRLSPHVAMACYVFLVNGNGVMNTRGTDLVTSTLFEVFQVYRELFSGTALKVKKVDMPSFLTPVRQDDLEGVTREVDYVDVSASLSESNDQINVAMINRHRDQSIEVDVVLPQWAKPQTVRTLYHDDPLAVNDFDSPDTVRFSTRPLTEWQGTWVCPPHSITILECRRP